MDEELITHYTFELAEPPCAPGSGRYGVRVTLFDDISPVFPYLNAALKETVYDHENRILIGRDEKRQYAFRSLEIQVAGINEASQAPEAVREAIELVNGVWRDRKTISPSFKERKLPTAMDIYKYLPKTNCRKCGCATCLVFAADLRTGRTPLEQCPPLQEPEHAGQREAIKKLFGSG